MGGPSATRSITLTVVMHGIPSCVLCTPRSNENLGLAGLEDQGRDTADRDLHDAAGLRLLSAPWKVAADGPTFEPLRRSTRWRFSAAKPVPVCYLGYPQSLMLGWVASPSRPQRRTSRPISMVHYIKSPFRPFSLSHLQPTAHSLAGMPAVCLARSRLATASFSARLTLESSSRIQIDPAAQLAASRDVGSFLPIRT
jgi:hypothetical protein